MLGITFPSPALGSNQSLSLKNKAIPTFQGDHNPDKPKLSLQAVTDQFEKMAFEPSSAHSTTSSSWGGSSGHSSPKVDLALLNALYSQNQPLLLEQLKEGADVNQCASNGWTPMMQVAKGTFGKKLHNLADLILHYKPDLDMQDERGSTATMEAVRAGNNQVLGKLLRRQPDLNLRDSEGKTALSLAAEKGEGEMAPLLLDGGADPNIPDNTGKRPIDWALERKDYQMFEVLAKGSPEYPDQKATYDHALEALANTEDEDSASLMATHILTAGLTVMKPEEVEQVLARNPELNLPGEVDEYKESQTNRKNGPTVLMRAAAKGDLDLVIQLVEAGASINQKAADHRDSIKYAYGKCQTVDSPQFPVLKYLFVQRAAQKLYNEGADPDQIDFQPLEDDFEQKLKEAGGSVKKMTL